MLLIVDIDMTIADCSRRLKWAGKPPKGNRDSGAWDKWLDKLEPPGELLKDPVIPLAKEIINSIRTETPLRLVYVTSRRELKRDETERWLTENGFWPGPLFMRPDHNKEFYEDFKANTIRRIVENTDPKVLEGSGVVVFDDHPDMARICQENGWLHMQVNHSNKPSLVDKLKRVFKGRKEGGVYASN